MNIYRLTEEEYKRILMFKRDLHMHPELSRKEVRTSAKIRDFLSTLPDFRILPLETETGTGVAAQITGEPKKAGREAPQDGSLLPTEIMLRADIDALPQTEAYESPWKSQTPGIMHARAKKDGALRNTVDLVFQPAEEGTTGAGVMIDAGLFEMIHPSYCFGIHNWPSVQTGRIACHEGALMSAKRNFQICIHGTGGHGSMPHLSIDPIVCAATVVQSLQTVVSRNTDPLDAAILTINMIEGGSPMNLVADKVLMRGSVRSLSDAALDRAIERVAAIAEKTAEAYECRAEILWKDRIPAVWNSPEMTALAKKCAAATGCEVTDAPPSLASEDFSRYRAFVPSFFYWVGSTAAGDEPQELHKPRFHTDDTALRHAAELYAVSAMLP